MGKVDRYHRTNRQTNSTWDLSSKDQNLTRQKYQHLSVSVDIDCREKTSETTNFIEKHNSSQNYGSISTCSEKHTEHLREANLVRKILIMAACLFLHITAGGTAVALGIIYVDLIRVFDTSHSQAALVQSLFLGTMLGCGVFFAGILQKFGTGVPVMIASFIAGIAFLAASFAPNVPTLIVLIGIVAGVSICVNFLSAFITISLAFQHNKKFYLAILTMGWTTGQISFPYLSEFLVKELQWNGSLVILSGFFLNCILCGLLFYTSRTYFIVSQPSIMTLIETIMASVKDYVFVVFLVGYFLFMFMAPVEMWFLADLAIVKGFDRSVGTFLISLIGITALIGRIAGTIFLRVLKLQALVHLFYAIMLWGIAHYLVGYFSELWGLIFAVVLRGLANGVSGAVGPGAQIEIRGIDKFPQTVAICNMMGGVSQTLGGLLGGATVDLTGGYNFIFTLAGVIFLVSSLLYLTVWCLLKKRTRSETSKTMVSKQDKATENDRAPLIENTR